ncbi:Multiple myeloma tumor-associated protein, putative [Ricinus communis]|uniref:Multiple myeloma tumor-associated protein, putative n=1 Tax=Ricinus communis TaxID=3988 RepID=B9RPU4_RICCO|nr:Multiple myeloma tumor-associated protein, putative [Ricinus communis]|eukprot:XP_002515763.1 multiple myeloma tumor-associated protein 2 homolog [Ricinus communis]
MYHPTRGGVRGGRDQFTWDDVKVDKHRENYLGHSIKAPVGRWQKGKDLHWYARDKRSEGSNTDALKEEIKRIKEEEEQAMREALGLAPKCASRPQGNRLDKHEFSELVKRGSTAEDLGGGHAEAARVDGLGFSRAPRPWEDPTTLPSTHKEVSPEPAKEIMPDPSARKSEGDVSEGESDRKRRKCEEKKLDKEKKHERRERHEKRRSHDSDDRRKHKKDRKRRHDSD